MISYNTTNTLFVYDVLVQQLWQQLCHRVHLVLIKLKIKNMGCKRYACVN